MSYFYEGYSNARAELQKASLDECLDLIDAHFGREEIEDESDIKEVRAEALRQQREGWTDKDSAEYERATFFLKVARAQQRNGRW